MVNKSKVFDFAQTDKFKQPQAYFLERKALQHTKFLPVFRFYTSLPRTSVLQGNASAGARWLRQYSFVRLQGAQTFVYKPDSSGSLRFFSIGAIANGGTANCQELQAIHFLI